MSFCWRQPATLFPARNINFNSRFRRHLLAIPFEQISFRRPVRKCFVWVRGARCWQSFPDQHLRRWQMVFAERIARLLPWRRSRKTDVHRKGARHDRVLVGSSGGSASSELALGGTQAFRSLVRSSRRDSRRLEHSLGRGHAFHARV